jgi:hypothetical protein
MMAKDVPDCQSIFCNRWKGHEGEHQHSIPAVNFPEVAKKFTEQGSLCEIKEFLAELVAARADDERWRKLVLERMEPIAHNSLIGRADTMACKEIIIDQLAQLSGKLDGLEAEFTADFAKLYNGHGLALQKLGDLIDAWNELMKLRPQPKRGKRRGRK